MTKNSPSVIYKSKYVPSLNSMKNSNPFKNGRKFALQDVDEMIDYFSNEKKKMVGMFEYYMGHTRGEHCNLVMEDGSYATKKDIKRIKENYKMYLEYSNLWKGILSFKKEYLSENIDIHSLEQRMAKEIMPKFLRYCGFKDIKNMSYVFSIHTNREHQPHIHFAFIEKCPNYMYCDNKVNYRIKGMITKDERNYLKRLVKLTIERDKIYTPILIKTNKDIDYLKTFFKPSETNFALKNIDDIYLEEDIIKLGELVKKYREKINHKSNKINYNAVKNTKLGNEITKLTKSIKERLFDEENSDLYNSKMEIENDLNRINDYFKTLDEENNVSDLIKRNDLVENKKRYIDNFVYNSIINHSLYKYNHIVKNKNNDNLITLDDLIQEVSYQNSKKNNYNGKQIRKMVLDNYFNGSDITLKFPSKYKLERNLKNLNYEMEKASQEFSKLFNYNDKYK